MNDYLDTGGVNARIAAFDKSHGASVYHDGWIRFVDGAYREANPLGLMVDPPTEPYELAKRKSHYHKIVFERAVRAFDQAKNNLRMMAQNNLASHICGPAPMTEQATADLKRLQQAAKAAKVNHDKAVAAVEASKPAYMRANEQTQLENQQRNRELLSRINEIEL